MKIFMLGGTGLLGAAGAKELIKRGHEVVSVALPPIPKDADIPQEMQLHLDNINTMSDEQIKQLLKGCEGFVFTAGVDERIEFEPPVYDVYHKYNIAPLARLLPFAKEVGVKKVIILGSYFAHFAKTMPQLELYKHHPYIRSRIDQENLALSFSDEKMEVMVLELPYIFGAQKGRKPVWMYYIDLLLPMKKKILFPKGGTTMLTVRQVGECIAGAIEKGKGGTCYPVGWENKTWIELLTLVTKYMGHPEKKVVTIPTFLYKLGAFKMAKDYKKKNIEPGLSPVEFVKLMTSNCFIDRSVIQNELGVTDDNIEEAIKDSIEYCMEIYNQNQKVVEMKAE
ncbi:MAG: NAD-dependent epimerase/dehydratase family protein [Christensenellales bacterium]|jgi:dihydroflavonol-4-reductase